MFWCISFRSGAFGTVSLLHENAPNWCNSCQSSCHDVLLEFFTTNAPDPYRWTLNSCFGAFLSVWVHLEPFCYYTKLAAKRAKQVQLMQKFVPRCLVRIFRNEHSWSTPLEPNLMFWCVSFCLVAFVTVSLLHETWCKTRQTGVINVKLRTTKSCHNFSQWTLTIHTIGP